MALTRTTINFAKKRNIEIVEDQDQITFYPLNDDSGEPYFTYNIGTKNTCTDEVSYFFKQNFTLDQMIKEELPYWVEGEKKLRSMIKFVASQIKE